MACLGLHRVVVLGTSYGGILAMAMGVAMPTVLAGIILNDIGPEIGAEGQARITAFLTQIRSHTDWVAAARQLRTLLPELSLTSAAEWADFARATYRRDANGLLVPDWDPAVFRATLQRREVIDLWPYFRSVRNVPMLVIRGGLSKVLSAATLEAMARNHSNLASLTLDAVGHAPALYEPECRSAIEAFLSEPANPPCVPIAN